MAFRYVKNIWAILRQVSDKDVWNVADTGAPTDGVSGTGVGMLGPGSTYKNVTTGDVFLNIGTKASPIWLNGNPISSSVLGGLGGVQVAKMTYDFAVDGGAISTILPANSPTIPTKAIILGGIIDIATTLTSGGAATIAIGTSAGSSTTSIKAATAVATWTAGLLVVAPIWSAGFFKMTAAGRPNLTIAAATLTAGKFSVQVLYFLGD